MQMTRQVLILISAVLPILLDAADVKGLKIGVAKEYFEGINPELKEAIDGTIKFYDDNGAEIVEISLPVLKQALPVYLYYCLC